MLHASYCVTTMQAIALPCQRRQFVLPSFQHTPGPQDGRHKAGMAAMFGQTVSLVSQAMTSLLHWVSFIPAGMKTQNSTLSKMFESVSQKDMTDKLPVVQTKKIISAAFFVVRLIKFSKSVQLTGMSKIISTSLIHEWHICCKHIRDSAAK